VGRLVASSCRHDHLAVNEGGDEERLRASVGTAVGASVGAVVDVQLMVGHTDAARARRKVKGACAGAASAAASQPPPCRGMPRYQRHS
jgi:hypothetical protein